MFIDGIGVVDLHFGEVGAYLNVGGRSVDLDLNDAVLDGKSDKGLCVVWLLTNLQGDSNVDWEGDEWDRLCGGLGLHEGDVDIVRRRTVNKRVH